MFRSIMYEQKYLMDYEVRYNSKHNLSKSVQFLAQFSQLTTMWATRGLSGDDTAPGLSPLDGTRTYM